MSRSLFFGWICWILSVTNALSASADAADLVRQLDAWDAAVAARDLNALAALAAEGYVYVEPDPQFVANAAADATDQTLQARLLDRVAVDVRSKYLDSRALGLCFQVFLEQDGDGEGFLAG